MSDHQNPQGKANLPGLPGLGPRTSSPPLPGIGAKPGLAPLPGLGAKPPAGAAPVPGARPSVPPSAFPGLGGGAPAGAARPSTAPRPEPAVTAPPPLVDYTPDPMTGGMPVATSSVPKRVVMGLVAVAVLFLGFNVGKAWSNRIQLNESLRDSMIVQYEIDKAIKLFDELDAVVNGAILKAGKYEYEPKHIEFLANNAMTSPIKAQVYTERSYRNFGRKAATALSSYGMKWAQLSYTINEHVAKTRTDAETLKSFSDKLHTVLKTQFGATFERKGADLFSNVMYIGKPEEKKGKVYLPVGASPDPTADPREAYNPSPDGDGGDFTKTPEAYTVIIAPEAKQGLLTGSGKALFNEYVQRLDDIRGKMKMMRDEQTSLARMLAELASQDPASIAPPDPETEFKLYVGQNAKAAAPSGAPASK